jgi:hypothetical protein
MSSSLNYLCCWKIDLIVVSCWGGGLHFARRRTVGNSDRDWSRRVYGMSGMRLPINPFLLYHFV